METLLVPARTTLRSMGRQMTQAILETFHVSLPHHCIIGIKAAGLDANVDDLRADFSTSWVQSVNQFSNTKEDAARRGLSQEAVRKSVSEDAVRKTSPPLEHDYF
ncbi:unnamed protein product [Heligmosomoides polygyrus]|uniref:KR domain-containing protein n=1 Tax=Heligmosomoides polygyrus TaxID=6339 RepID=A0A183G3H9_HELPZ|nr:unnamed protein product [Heligmosomoides polygyrus]